MSIKIISPVQNNLLPGAANTVAQQRAVANQAKLTGAANNLSAQSAVVSEKQAMERRRAQQLLGRSTRSAMIGALAPAVASHLDDEEDHDTSDPRRRPRGNKRITRPPEQK